MRPLTSALAVGLSATALATSTSGTAQAANAYPVKADVPKPAAACGNHGTIRAGGWLANKRCGYVLGTAPAGTSYEVNSTDAKGYHFGRTRDRDGSSFCAFLVPGALDTARRTPVGDSCSSATAQAMVHRLSFGRDFSDDVHSGNGASTKPVDASACAGYLNYFTSSTFAGGRLRDPVAGKLPATGAYRYTTRDGKAAMIRVGTGDSTTWLFVARSCVAPTGTLWNTDD